MGFLGEQYRNPFYRILTLPIWVNFWVFRQFWWFWGSGRVFLSGIGVEINPKQGLGGDLCGFGGSRTFVFHDLCFCNELFNFSSTSSPQSARGSPSKASELDFCFVVFFEFFMERFCFLVLGFIFDEVKHRECVRTSSFEKCCTTHQSAYQMNLWSSSYDQLLSLARSIVRSIARSLDRSIARSTYRSLAHSIARSLDPSIHRSLDRSIAPSLDRSLAWSLARLIARTLARLPKTN